MVSDQTMNLKYKNRVLCPSRQNSTFFFLTLRCVDDKKRSFTSENGTMTEISSNMKNSIVTSEMKMDQVKLPLGTWLPWIRKTSSQNPSCTDCTRTARANDVRACAARGGSALASGVPPQKNQHGWFRLQLDELDVGAGSLQTRGGDVVKLGGASGVYGRRVVPLVCLGGSDKCHSLVSSSLPMNCST